MQKKNSNSDIKRIQKAIREEYLANRGERLDGWLFCNFRHRDPLADEILGLSQSLSNSRYWFYAVPSSGTPLALVHAIEADILDGFPGTKQTYVGRDDLRSCFAPLAGKRWAVHMSETVSAVSFLDAGIYNFLTGASLELVSAEKLIQRFKGVLEKDAIASHERAARALYGIVAAVWDFVRASYHGGKKLYEGDLRRVMDEAFVRNCLIRDHPPLVAAGGNSANPHYDFSGPGSLIGEGDIIQLDLWAKEPVPAGAARSGIYADISWAGVYAKAASPAVKNIFADLVDAREKTLDYLAAAFPGKQKRAGTVPALSGAEVDRYCRSLLCEKGYEAALKHRTGHGIDTEVHGSGVNIDSVEFPDHRHILEGSCFSVEPGLYFVDYGFRTEINVYIKDRRPVVSGLERQFSLLHC